MGSYRLFVSLVFVGSFERKGGDEMADSHGYSAVQHHAASDSVRDTPSTMLLTVAWQEKKGK
jgi:hypothetical protein